MRCFRNKKNVPDIHSGVLSSTDISLSKNVLRQKTTIALYYTFLYTAAAGLLLLNRIFLFLTKCVHYCLLEDKLGNITVLNTYFFKIVNPF